MKKMYVVYSGNNYESDSFDSIWDKKKDAIAAIRKMGAKYKMNEDTYYQYEKGFYYKIDEIVKNELFRNW